MKFPFFRFFGTQVLCVIAMTGPCLVEAAENQYYESLPAREQIAYAAQNNSLVGATGSHRSHISAKTNPERRPLQSVKIPGTDYEIDFTKKQSGGVLPSQALIKAIKYWLTFNFNLRATYPDPYIELAEPEKIILLRYHGFLSDWPRDIVLTDQQVPVPFEDMMASHDRNDAIAVYDNEMKTIYLPKNWTGSTPTELSILVHEMVHHLQGATKTRYECPQAREQLAYAAQEKWLGLFGRNLESEFEIDPLTLVVSTRCIY
jgi:hypothetical protein